MFAFLTAAATAGILYTGTDSPTASAAIAAIESHLAGAPDVMLRSATEIGRPYAAASPATDERAQAEEAALAEAERLFYSGKFDEALARLGGVEEAIAKSGEASPATVRARFLAGMIALKRGDSAGARAAFRTGLLQDPDARTDALPADMQVAIETERAALPPRVTLRTVVTPPDAHVTVDGRNVADSVLAVVAGPHQVVVSGPGLVRVVRMVEVKEDVSIRVALAPQLAVPTARALSAWALDPSKPAPQEIRDLARDAKLDAIFLVAVRAATARAVLWRDGKAVVGPIAKVDASGEMSALGEWAAAQMRRGAVATTIAAPNPSRSRERHSKGWLWLSLGVLGAGLAGGAVAGASASGGGTKKVGDARVTTVVIQ